MVRVEVVQIPHIRTATAEADVPQQNCAVSAADLGAALVCEIGRLNEEARRLQALAARMAQTRPEFEAWFEAGPAPAPGERAAGGDRGKARLT